jgi:hypothetical protein
MMERWIWGMWMGDVDGWMDESRRNKQKQKEGYLG